MMTRKITIIALIAGIVLGAAATEGFNVYRQSQESYRQSHDSRIFQERAHCKAVADAYVKENTDLNDSNVAGGSVTLEKVDYSPARNSCVAELNTTHYARSVFLEFYSVQDLLSGETLFSTKCTGDCVESVLKLELVDPAFDYIMNNASIPMEVEKKWALKESSWQKAFDSISNAPASQPKSALPSAVTQWDAQGNPIPSKYPPKSAPQPRR
jgi:hypothetical protein